MIKVTKGNNLVLTNISYDHDCVYSINNINSINIAICIDNGIMLCNKKYKKKSNLITKPKESHRYPVVAEAILGIARHKYMILRD